MAHIELTNFASLSPDEREGLDRIVSEHRGIDDIFAWGRQQSPAIVPADVIKQDEFTHDVLVPIPGNRWLVYGTT
jgi:hypothetical protein